MSGRQAIEALLRSAGRVPECKAARAAWARATAAALRDAHRKADEAWERIFEALPEDLSEEELDAMHIPDPPEQAQVDAIYVRIRAAIDEDRWPRELYRAGL